MSRPGTSKTEDTLDARTDRTDRHAADTATDTAADTVERHPDAGQLPSDTDVLAERQVEGGEAEVSEELVEAERRRRAEELPPEARSGGSDV